MEIGDGRISISFGNACHSEAAQRLWESVPKNITDCHAPSGLAMTICSKDIESLRPKFFMRKNTRMLTHGALLAALYAALCYLQNVLLPGSASWAIQFRAAEALCVLALFTPAAIPGLTVGCLLFNLSFSGALPLDPVLGTAATLFATAAMYFTRKLTVKGYPFLSLLMPAVFNAILVGWELSIYIGGGFRLNALYVAIGEIAVLLTLGTLLFYTLQRSPLRHYF